MLLAQKVKFSNKFYISDSLITDYFVNQPKFEKAGTPIKINREVRAINDSADGLIRSELAQYKISVASSKHKKRNPVEMEQVIMEFVNEASAANYLFRKFHPAVGKESLQGYKIADNLSILYFDTYVTLINYGETAGLRLSVEKYFGKNLGAQSFLGELPNNKVQNAIVVDANTQKEVTAQFPGGIDSLRKYVAQQIKVRQRILELENDVFTGVIGFKVEPDGSITNIKMLRPVSEELDKIALDVIRSMPKWKPASEDGKAVPIAFRLPIAFFFY